MANIAIIRISEALKRTKEGGEKFKQKDFSRIHRRFKREQKNHTIFFRIQSKKTHRQSADALMIFFV